MDNWTCSSCETTKPKDQYYRSSARPSGIQQPCKACRKATFTLRYWNNPEPFRAESRERQRENRRNNKDWYILRRKLSQYKITLDQYAALEEAQNWACAICERDDVELHIDHNHETDKVRGFLCERCNVGLGQFGDNINYLCKAVDYLVRKGDYSTHYTAQCEGKRARSKEVSCAA